MQAHFVTRNLQKTRQYEHILDMSLSLETAFQTRVGQRDPQTSDIIRNI